MADAAPAPSRVPSHALAEAVAELLGKPMPAGWWLAEAIQARQDHLAAVASYAAAAFNRAQSFRGTPELDIALRLFSVEMVALDDAMRDYTGMTARGDVLDVVRDALIATTGSALADALIGMLVRVRGDDVRLPPQACLLSDPAPLLPAPEPARSAMADFEELGGWAAPGDLPGQSSIVAFSIR